MGGAELAAIEHVYRSRYDRFCRLTLMVVGDPLAAADVVQEAFARAVKSRASFRGDCPLEAWLWRIAVNVAHEYARRPRRELADLEALEGVEAEAGPGAGGAGAVRAQIARLPERQRTALFLRYYADLDYESIGKVMGIAPGTVAATLNRAHVALRDVLGEARLT